MKKLIICFCLLNTFIHGHTQPVSTIEKNFQNPPVSARPKALWPWVNGNVNLSQVTYELEESKRKGMGGFDIWDIGASVDPNKRVSSRRISVQRWGEEVVERMQWEEMEMENCPQRARALHCRSSPPPLPCPCVPPDDALQRGMCA